MFRFKNTTILCNLQANSFIVTAIRNFSPKTHPYTEGKYRGEIAYRHGYEAHDHTKGLLPRLKLKEARLSTMPLTRKEDDWSHRVARMGENDFIKILGDQDIEQHELLTHIPDWLRGYRNTFKEYTVLMRKRKELEHWRETKPQKWMHMEQRIKYLYRRINNKYTPPGVELLNKSRHQI